MHDQLWGWRRLQAERSRPTMGIRERLGEVVEQLWILLERDEGHRVFADGYRHRDRQDHRDRFGRRELHLVDEELTAEGRHPRKDPRRRDFVDRAGEAAHVKSVSRRRVCSTSRRTTLDLDSSERLE